MEVIYEVLSAREKQGEYKQTFFLELLINYIHCNFDRYKLNFTVEVCMELYRFHSM